MNTTILDKASFKKKKTYRRHEEQLQLAVCKYIKLAYPDVIFFTDASGLRLSKSQAGKQKAMRSEGAHVDLYILEPRLSYHGLILELKADNNSPFLKNGELSKDQHVMDQAKTLDRLKNKGYLAQFSVGLVQTMDTIDEYLKST
jgi:hypothetical protein